MGSGGVGVVPVDRYGGGGSYAGYLRGDRLCGGEWDIRQVGKVGHAARRESGDAARDGDGGVDTGWRECTARSVTSDDLGKQSES